MERGEIACTITKASGSRGSEKDAAQIEGSFVCLEASLLKYAAT